MKKIYFFLMLAASLQAGAQTTTKSAADTSEAYKFILDYTVPSSPAFTALDLDPQKVTRGSAAKPLVIHAFTNFLQTGKLDPGVAVDFSPYLLLGGGFANLDEYRTNTYKRILANSMLSAAVIKNLKDSANTDFGLGARITLLDDHDLFSNKAIAKKITDKIGNALAGAAQAPAGGNTVQDDEVGSGGNITQTVAVDMKSFYADAYEQIRKTKGWAVSLGFGFRATARSSFASSDSLVNKQSKLWLSSTRYTQGGFDIYSIVQGSFTDTSASKWIAGLAVGGKNKSSNMGAELVYDFYAKKWDYGANFEIRLFKQLTYIISLNRASFLVNGVDVGSKFRVLSNFRFDLFGH